MRLSETAEQAIAAYGGHTRWQNAKYVEAEVSVSGLAFTLKRRPFFPCKNSKRYTQAFYRVTPIGHAHGISGFLDSQDVHLEYSRGEVLSGRENAQDYFTPDRRLFYWEDLDIMQFFPLKIAI